MPLVRGGGVVSLWDELFGTTFGSAAPSGSPTTVNVNGSNQQAQYQQGLQNQNAQMQAYAAGLQAGAQSQNAKLILSPEQAVMGMMRVQPAEGDGAPVQCMAIKDDAAGVRFVCGNCGIGHIHAGEPSCPWCNAKVVAWAAI